MKNEEIKIKEVAYRRNGISGEGFNVVTFDYKVEGEKGKRPMVGIVFEAVGHVAVFDTNELAKSNIAFAHGNSWRGDNFAGELREAIKKHDDAMRKEWQKE